MATRHECRKCGRYLREAEDQTDAGHNEVAVDTRGLVSANEWVCGRCLEGGESRKEDIKK
jgi:hypothetical protein